MSKDSLRENKGSEEENKYKTKDAEEGKKKKESNVASLTLIKNTHHKKLKHPHMYT